MKSFSTHPQGCTRTDWWLVVIQLSHSPICVPTITGWLLRAGSWTPGLCNKKLKRRKAMEINTQMRAVWPHTEFNIFREVIWAHWTGECLPAREERYFLTNGNFLFITVYILIEIKTGQLLNVLSFIIYFKYTYPWAPCMANLVILKLRAVFSIICKQRVCKNRPIVRVSGGQGLEDGSTIKEVLGSLCHVWRT